MIIEVIRGLGMGGAETLLYNRLRHTVSEDIAASKTTIVVNTLPTASFYTERIRELGIRVVEIGSSGPLSGVLGLRRFLREFQCDVTVVFHSPVTSYLEKLRRILWKKSVPPLIEVVHTSQYRFMYRLLGPLLDRYVDLAIAVSGDVARAPTTSHFKSVATVLAGVDIDRMRDWLSNHPDAPGDFRKSLGISCEAPLLVAVGSLISLKGHKHAIQALRTAELANATLVIVGDGPERAALIRQAEEQGVSARVHLVGIVPDGWAWTAVADALVHPSYFEGLPVTLMEAAALGTPIVATGGAGAQQVLERGGTGVLIEKPSSQLLSNAVVQVLEDTMPIAAAFPTRGMKESYWSIDRYSVEFYALLQQVRARHNSSA